MQTSGQFEVPPSEVPLQYNTVNSNMNNSSNTGSRATSTPGSNQTLGHMLFNLSSHDQQLISLSPSSTLNTLPHLAHTHDPNAPLLLQLDKAKLPESAPGAKLQDAASTQQHNETRQFSHFLHVPVSASTSTSLEHFPWPDHGAASMEKSVAENILMQQQKQNSTSGVPRADTNPQTLRPMGTMPVQAHTPSTSTPHPAAPELALKHTTDIQVSLDNVESEKQAEGVQPHHHHHPQLTLGFEKAANLPPSNMKPRERQVMITDPMGLGDIDQADEAACAGNRWPRPETLALLKIRADMDAVFRDTSVKRPLWDEVSRKLGELGYERSAKKCKEKFENVNKYYKRTKEGKVGRQVGKNYRFFTQLEALHSADHSTSNMASVTPIPATPTTTTTTDPIILKLQAAPAAASPSLPGTVLARNLPSADNRMGIDTLVFTSSSTAQPTSQLPGVNLAYCPPPHLDGNAGTALHSSSQSSDDDDEGADDDDIEDDNNVNVVNEDDDSEHGKPKPQPHGPHGPSHALPPTDQSKKRKRKSSTSMMAFFEDLLKRVMDKQEQMQQMFLQVMEKRESDRMIREEAWRRQEMARLSKEHDLRVQERSSAAARDAALIAFLQKVTGQAVDLPTVSTSTSVPIAAQPVQSAPPFLHQEIVLHRYEDHDASDPSSKRWLKPEVLHLIELHRSLQAKFTEAGPKGPLWEEIANGMTKMGYANRTAKRCKEKWENINKYFKRTKESSKKRPDNAKTCPYFQELDALYRKGSASSNNVNQLSYKPSIEHGQDENVAQQASLSGRDGDLDRASSLQMQPSNLPMEHAAVSDASNASGTDPNNNRSITLGDDAMRNMSSGNGILQSAGTMQLSMDAFRNLNATSTSEQTAQRGGFSAELGLGTQEQSSSLSIYQQKPESQAGFGKLNYTGRGEHMESSITHGELQCGTSKESKPCALAPLPNATSFMATMLQKLASNDTTSANSNPQDQ